MWLGAECLPDLSYQLKSTHNNCRAHKGVGLCCNVQLVHPPYHVPSVDSTFLPSALQDTDGQLIWRYAMPQGKTASSAPQGGGDGAYAPLQAPSAVVAVVGSAHVRGMCKAWQDSLAAPGQVDELLKV